MTTFSVFWYTLEAQIGLLAACLPTTPGFFKDSRIASSLKAWWGSMSGSLSSPKVEIRELPDSAQSILSKDTDSTKKSG
jgi:hypothetical protein